MSNIVSIFLYLLLAGIIGSMFWDPLADTSWELDYPDEEGFDDVLFTHKNTEETEL